MPEPVAPEPPVLEVAAPELATVPLMPEGRKPETAIEAVQEGEDDPEIDAFIARRLEFVAGETPAVTCLRRGKRIAGNTDYSPAIRNASPPGYAGVSSTIKTADIHSTVACALRAQSPVCV